MNWFPSGFINILTYSNLSSIALFQFAILTEGSDPLLTEGSDYLLTEDA